MKPDPYKKDIVIRKSYSKDHGNWRKSKLKVDVSDPDNMVDIKHTVSTRKIGGFWSSSDSWINYRHLTRFFKAHVGQPFDKVYSELCAMADKRSWAGLKWREEAIGELIHRSPCEEKEDGLYTLEGHKVESRYGRTYDAYYVDAQGILKIHKAAPKARYTYSRPDRNKEDIHSVKLDKTLFLIRCDGTWYSVKTKDLNYLDKHTDKVKLLHKLTTEIDRDVVLYQKTYNPIYSEPLQAHRWEALIRKTYCGELHVGIQKTLAADELIARAGLMPNRRSHSFSYCECEDLNCPKHHQGRLDKTTRAANALIEDDSENSRKKTASFEALMALFE